MVMLILTMTMMTRMMTVVAVVMAVIAEMINNHGDGNFFVSQELAETGQISLSQVTNLHH